jgi:hypothetical protein
MIAGSLSPAFDAGARLELHSRSLTSGQIIGIMTFISPIHDIRQIHFSAYYYS